MRRDNSLEPNRPALSYVRALVIELGDLRERGLLGIDDDQPKRKRKALRELTHMADRYCTVKGHAFNNRIDEIGSLLRDSLAGYSEVGHVEIAAILSRLFFEPSAIKSPGDVLAKLRDENSDWSDYDWKSNWERWRHDFAAFLIEFVSAAGVTPRPAKMDATTNSAQKQSSHRKLLTKVNRELSSIFFHWNLDRTSLPSVGRLAREYCDAKDLSIRNRDDQIRKLLHDTLRAFSESGHVEEGKVIAQFLIDRSEPSYIVRKKLGFKAKDFDKYWATVRPLFAELLVALAQEVIASGRSKLPTNPVHAFAWELRRLRQRSGNPSYGEMEWMSGVWMNREPGSTLPQSAFADAEGGDWLPNWRTVEVYVKTCGGDPAEWRERWNQVYQELYLARRRRGKH